MSGRDKNNRNKGVKLGTEIVSGVLDSFGVDASQGVRNCSGIYRCTGITSSSGVSKCSWVDTSAGLSNSSGVIWGTGVHASAGVEGSSGVNSSFGIFKSFGVNGSLFVTNYRGPRMLFNKVVTDARADGVQLEFIKLCKGWRPTFNNVKSLFLDHGSDWEKVPLKETSPLFTSAAWAGMPQEAIDYLKSLPEFDPVVFEEVTGIRVYTEKEVHKS